MSGRLIKNLMLSVVLLMPVISSAETFSDPIIRISGFGTAAIDHSNNQNADWVSTMEETEGVGYSKETSMTPDSLIGVQLDTDINEKLSATLQIVSRSLIDNTSTPQVEWANIQYKVTPNSLLRIGRMSNNTFLYSEDRLVGFVRPTIHLPYTYAMNPADQINGLDYTYTFSHKGIVYTLGANYGVFNQNYDIFEPSVEGDVLYVHARMGSLHFSMSHGNHFFRMTYEAGHIDLNDQFFEGYRQGLQALTAENLPYSADELKITPTANISMQYAEAAYVYNGNRWKWTNEWMQRSTNTVMAIPTTRGFYSTLGYSINRFMPYIQIDHVRQTTSSALPPLSGGPSALAPVVGMVNAFNVFMQSGTDRMTYSAGFRWNPIQKLDLKVQYDYMIKPAGSQGGFNYINPNSNFINDRQAIQLYSAAVDFVF